MVSCLVGRRCISTTIIRFAGISVCVFVSLGSSMILATWFSSQAYRCEYLLDLGSSTVQASGGDSRSNIKLGLSAGR